MKTKNEENCFLDWYKERRRRRWTFVKEIKQKLLNYYYFYKKKITKKRNTKIKFAPFQDIHKWR